MDAYLACVDVVGIGLQGSGVGTYSHDTVLALQMDLHVFGQHRGEKGGNADTQIDVHAISNFLGCSAHDFESDVVLARA